MMTMFWKIVYKLNGLTYYPIGGGGGDQVDVAVPSAGEAGAPEFGESIQDFINSLPQLLAAQQEFAPQFAGLQQQIQQQLFPITSGLQETLAGQALEGIEDPLSEELQQEFLNTQRALTGRQSAAPIGGASISRNLLGLKEGRRQQSQSLALSLAGRQPLASGAGGQQFVGLQPGQALGFNQGIFGQQVGLGIAGLQAGTARRGQNLQLFGDFFKAVGTGVGGTN